MIEAICRRYHCTPAEAARQPAWILQHLAILALATGSDPLQPATEDDPSLAAILRALR